MLFRSSWGQDTFFAKVTEEDDVELYGLDTVPGEPLDPNANYVPFAAFTTPFDELEEAIEEFNATHFEL